MCRCRSSVLWRSFFAGITLCFLMPSFSVAQARKASLQEMTETSHAIFTGKCLKKESAWNQGRTKIFTEVRIRTGEMIKGDPAAEVVLTIPGGQVGSTVYEVSDMPAFLEGEEVLVFLWKHPSGKNLVTGALQGKLTLVEEKSTGKKLVHGAGFLGEDVQLQKTQNLQKTAIEKIGEPKVYLDDLKSDIRKYLGK